VDLRSLDAPIFDQAQENSCGGNAYSDLADFLQLKAIREGRLNAPECFGPSFQAVSRQFNYRNARFLEGTADQDEGVGSMVDLAKGGAQFGVCRESVWPYLPENVDVTPSHAAFAEAALHRLPNYYEITDLQDVKLCLSHGFPVMLGIVVYDSIMSDEVADTGAVPMPSRGDSEEGGHAVVIIGYDDSKQVWILRNSWGTSWGMKGYFTLPYSYLASGLGGDFFTLRPAPQAI
jgi:hypothetical protein